MENVVPGEPAGEPHQPKAIHDDMGQEHWYSATVAGERAEEPHQHGTSSEAMDRQRQQPVVRGDRRSDSKRVGKALHAILQHAHADQWVTIDELLVRLHRAPARTHVEAVLAGDTRRCMCRLRGVDAGGWVEYAYCARPKTQR